MTTGDIRSTGTDEKSQIHAHNKFLPQKTASHLTKQHNQTDIIQFTLNAVGSPIKTGSLSSCCDEMFSCFDEFIQEASSFNFRPP